MHTVYTFQILVLKAIPRTEPGPLGAADLSTALQSFPVTALLLPGERCSFDWVKASSLANWLSGTTDDF